MLYSSDPATSAQRLILSLVTYALAGMLPWLTRGMHQFANVLLIAASSVVVLSYLGIALFPHLADEPVVVPIRKVGGLDRGYDAIAHGV